MAKGLVVCFRKTVPLDLEDFAKRICEKIAPDNVDSKQPYVSIQKNILSLIYNPNESIVRNELSFCLGISDSLDQLFNIGAIFPNGSYALFRGNEDAVEAGTDFAASRTMWYYFDSNVFIVSTSQRMMIPLLGNFDFNQEACSWFLASGTLGPGISWDKRIKMIPPRTTIKLNRKMWKLTMEIRNDSFSFNTKPYINSEFSTHREDLNTAVKNAVSSLKINPKNWILALSGGMDSRSLLFHLRDENLQAVTWGLNSVKENPISDAYIASQLAKHCNIEHSYAKMDYKQGSFPILLDRFIAAGECRIDHLAGYLDGLELWGKLSKTNRGVIRGYDSFGRKPNVKNSYQVRRNSNMHLTSDFPDNSIIPDKYFISESTIPSQLEKKGNESLEDWRDRLWLQHRTPITTAALEDIKLAYVEVINPLLSKPIIQAVQSLPVKLRDNKRVWKSIITEMFPNIPLARQEAVQEVIQILNEEDVSEYICDSLYSLRDSDIFPESFVLQVIDNYGKNRNVQSFRRKIRRFIIAYLPKRIENWIRSKISPDPLNNQFLALRTLMILKAQKMILEDIQYVRSPKNIS